MNKAIKALFALGIGALVIGCASGPPAPEANFYPLDGSAKISLSSLKGQAVLLDAWATWCGPCRETMPMIQALHEKYKEKGLKVMAVSNDPANAVKKFLEDNPYTYPFFLDKDDSFMKGFQVSEIPTTILVDKNGNVVWRGHPAQRSELEQAIQAAL